MTCNDHSTTSRFDAALVDFTVAEAAARAIEEHPHCLARHRINKVLEDAVDTIFAIAAPTLGGVARKLEVYWSELLLQHDWYGVDWRKKAVGDIRRIERQLAGVEEPDASGGMDMSVVEFDWTEELQEYDHWAELLDQGRSESWGKSNQSDIVAFKDHAQEVLLSLPAPNLAAVIKKLELLWTDDRFDPVFEATDHLLILRDLRRFALKHQQ